jgi:HEPN domain-containing protein
MNDAVRQWLEKAENDFSAANTLFHIKSEVMLTDAVCFHCQQCIEKLIKGCLLARNIDPPKVHDLKRLHRLLRKQEPNWDWTETELDRLSGGAVIFRYPGETATIDEARMALDIATRCRIALLPLLDVPDKP